MRMMISPSSLALDAADDGTIKMSSSALDAANEDDNESVIGGGGCSQGRDNEDVFICTGFS